MRSINRTQFSIPALAALALFGFQFAAAIEIQIDYRFDDSGFFASEERRAAIESVAEFYGPILQDTLLRIDPADFPQASWSARPTDPETGGAVNLPGLVVPENTIIVFVGSRELGGNVRGQAGPGGFSANGFPEWFTRIRGRGNPGAESQNDALKTDHAPWGGTITFDTTTNFNFSTQGGGSATDFLSVALHEMAHVLGIGLVASWDNLISGGTFNGPAASRSAGTNPPVQNGGGHFNGTTLTSPAFGSFAIAHGQTTPVLMLPSSTTGGGSLNVITDLDLAALRDIGWEVVPPASLNAVTLGPAAASFAWPSSSFASYRVERGTDLAAFGGGSPPFSGDGRIQTWSDPAPPSGRAFYRLSTSADPPAIAGRARSSTAAGGYASIIVEPRPGPDCGYPDH